MVLLLLRKNQQILLQRRRQRRHTKSNVTVIVVAWILQLQTRKGFYQEKDAQKSIVYFLYGTPMCMRESNVYYLRGTSSCMRKGMKRFRHIDLCFDRWKFSMSFFGETNITCGSDGLRCPWLWPCYSLLAFKSFAKYIGFMLPGIHKGSAQVGWCQEAASFFVCVSILDKLRNSSNSHWWILSVCPLSYLNILCFQILFGLHWDSPIESLLPSL